MKRTTQYLAMVVNKSLSVGAAIAVGNAGRVGRFDKLIAEYGVDRRLYTSGDRKAILDPFQPEKADDVATLRALQADIHESFKDWVRDRRGERLQGEEAALFSGQFWTGRQAEPLGLIDGLGDLRGVLRERFGKKLRLQAVNPPRQGLAQLFGGGAARAALNAFDERAAWARIGASGG